MNIVEKEANSFIARLYHTGRLNNIETLKSKIESKLYDFKRDRDKLDFLKIARQLTQIEKEEHLLKCQTPGCKFPEERDLGIFLIDQEIDEINSYYVFETKISDRFSPEEESKLHSKLNDIIEKLEKQGDGQEIIFEEIESLKNHFNLGKKTWFQLVKGKVVDLTLEKVLEESIVKDIYNSLSDGFNEVTKFIE